MARQNVIDTFLYSLSGVSSPWRIDNGNPNSSGSKLNLSGSDKVSRAVSGSYMIEFDWELPIASAGVPIASAYIRTASFSPLFSGIPSNPWYFGAPPLYPPMISLEGANIGSNRAFIYVASVLLGYVGLNIMLPPDSYSIKVALFVKTGEQKVSWAVTSNGSYKYDPPNYLPVIPGLVKGSFTTLTGTFDFSRVSLTGDLISGVGESVVYGRTSSIFVADGMTDADVQTAFNNYPTLPTIPPAPEDGSSGHSLTPTLSFPAAVIADGYSVEVYRDFNLSSLACSFISEQSSINFVEQAGLIGFPLDFNQTYYWRFRSFIGQTFSVWSNIYSFSTETETLSFAPIFDHAVIAKAAMMQQFKGGI